MDRRERTADREEQQSMAQDRHQSTIWTALPGIIQSFDSSALTCTVQPAIKGKALIPDGSTAETTLPQLLDCPVVFPGGGGCTLTFPLAAGDECLVVFSSRCIDAWWQHGTVSAPPEFRMHDLSDGFVIPGPRSQPRKITAAASAQLRTDDGSVFVQVNGSGVLIKGNVTVQGNLTITGVTKTNNTLNLNTHVHSGVTPGSGNTGAPV